VPTISIAYSVKAKGINQDLFGHQNTVLETPALSKDILIEKFKWLFANETAIQNHLKDRLNTGKAAGDLWNATNWGDFIVTDVIAPVSVVIPCYRCGATIKRAVDSVAAQTLRPAEVILIEDGSGDNTLEQLYRVQGEHPKDWIKIIALEKNSGPSFARNTGWDAATQPYIAFLDADDSWHPQKTEIQYQWMAAHPKVCVD